MRVERTSVSDLLRVQLRAPGTYLLAIVVGTVINLYGHLLVPTLHGENEPVSSFFWKLVREPGVMTLSVGIAYLFPFLVGLTSSVRAHRAFSCPRCEGTKDREAS